MREIVPNQRRHPCLGDRFAVPEVEGHNIPSVRQHVDMPEIIGVKLSRYLE